MSAGATQRRPRASARDLTGNLRAAVRIFSEATTEAQASLRVARPPLAMAVLRHRRWPCGFTRRRGVLRRTLDRVLDDVGVRFGGSEHHRIGISSSHTRHPALAGREPDSRVAAGGVLRSVGGCGPDGAGRSASSEVRRSASRSGHLLGAKPDIVVTVTDALRSGGGEPRRGCSLRHSSEWRLADLERGRQTAFFGAPRVGLTGTGSIVLFGTRSHPSHREQDSWTLRTIGTHPIGNGKSIATSLGAR